MKKDYELRFIMSLGLPTCREDKDCRRIMFEKQEELLGQPNENWRIKENVEHQSILKSRPYDDLAGLRATYSGQPRKQGQTETET